MLYCMSCTLALPLSSLAFEPQIHCDECPARAAAYTKLRGSCDLCERDATGRLPTVFKGYEVASQLEKPATCLQR